MKRKLYAVCWDDEAYPKIVRTEDKDGLSFIEAKKEVFEHYKNHVSHWMAVKRMTKKVKPSEVDPIAELHR